MRQITLIGAHLRAGLGITSKEAFEAYGVTRLSSIIFDLRQRGYDIDTEMVDGQDRWGNKVRYARYSMKKNPDDDGENVL